MDSLKGISIGETFALEASCLNRQIENKKFSVKQELSFQSKPSI